MQEKPSPISTPSILKSVCADRAPLGENGENGEDSSFSPNSPGGYQPRVHPIPEDSILHDAVQYNRELSEAPDSFTTAPLLCVAARLLTPNCSWNFAGTKYMNLFNFVVGPPGIRKSTAFGLAERLSIAVLPPEALHDGSASDSALFDRFEIEHDILQIEDEGNTLIEYWSRQGSGKELSARYLKLYDAKGWSQTFKNQKDSKGGAHRRIERTTLSFALGGTPNTSKFGGISTASGLRRRFGYYVSLRQERDIIWPEAPGSIDHLVRKFQKLDELSGVFRMNPDADELWKDIHAHFSSEQRKIISADSAAEAKQAALAESPSRTLKLAGIFEACRWAKTGEGNGLTVRKETLKLAFEHQLACLDAADEMETIGRRSAIEEKAEVVLAGIRTDPKFQSHDGWHSLTRSQLTNKFANNSSRVGSLTTQELYQEIIPSLERRNLCRQTEKVGKLCVYHFAAETTEEL